MVLEGRRAGIAYRDGQVVMDYLGQRWRVHRPDDLHEGVFVRQEATAETITREEDDRAFLADVSARAHFGRIGAAQPPGASPVTEQLVRSCFGRDAEEGIIRLHVHEPGTGQHENSALIRIFKDRIVVVDPDLILVDVGYLQKKPVLIVRSNIGAVPGPPVVIEGTGGHVRLAKPGEEHAPTRYDGIRYAFHKGGRSISQ